MSGLGLACRHGPHWHAVCYIALIWGPLAKLNESMPNAYDNLQDSSGTRRNWNSQKFEAMRSSEVMEEREGRTEDS